MLRAAFAGAAAIPAIAVLAAAHRYGPPAAHTGGFGERTCHECHFDNDVNTPGGAVTVRGFPQAYEPGRAYPLEIVLARPETLRGGFQLAIRYADGSHRGASAGSLEAKTRGVVVVDSLGVHYAQHTEEATLPVANDTIRWSIVWKPPDAGGGGVALNVAANASNDDDSPFGDYIYSFEAGALEATSTVLHATGADAMSRAAPLHSGVQRGQAMREGYITMSDSARLFYRVIGHGGGRRPSRTSRSRAPSDTLIAIHGGPGVDLESIAGDFAPLAERHVVIFYDQRGTGRSELPADTTCLSVKRQIADLDEVRAHFGIGRVTLVAHSYGPLLAASYALAHPDHVRSMVFFGPVPPRRGDFWQRFGASMSERLDSTARAGLADAARRLADPAADTRQACRDYWAINLRPRLAEPDRTLPLLRSDFCASDPAGIRYGLTVTNRVVMGYFGDWDLRDRLRTLETPTLVVHGEEDSIPMDLVEEWVSSLPHARLFRVPRAAHFTYAERPDIVWPEVERFLAGTDDGR